jgi:hypothetical protein
VEEHTSAGCCIPAGRYEGKRQKACWFEELCLAMAKFVTFLIKHYIICLAMVEVVLFF